jgi:hypothetical protein
MAVLSVFEVDGREVERTDDMNRRITRQYQIRCSLPDEEEASVLIGSGMPVILAPHPTVPQLRCTSVKVKQHTDNDPFVWTATVAWQSLILRRSAKNNSSDPSQRDPNPLQRPPILSFTTERFQRPVFKDKKGKAVVNSAGDPFETPLLVDDFRPTVTISRNVASWSITEWRNAINCVNDSPFLGFDIGDVKLADLTGQSQFENNQYFYTKTGVFHVTNDTENGWLAEVLDCGYQKLLSVDADGHEIKREIFLAGGTKPSSPVQLDGTGGVLGRGLDPVFREFTLYDSYDFDSLGLI